jgi:hypothetical protein
MSLLLTTARSRCPALDQNIACTTISADDGAAKLLTALFVTAVVSK